MLDFEDYKLKKIKIGERYVFVGLIRGNNFALLIHFSYAQFGNRDSILNLRDGYFIVSLKPQMF